jgi:hypothetical protein
MGSAVLADEYLAVIDVHGTLDVLEAVRTQAEGGLEQRRTGWQREAAQDVRLAERLKRTAKVAQAGFERAPRRLDAHLDRDCFTHRPAPS